MKMVKIKILGRSWAMVRDRVEGQAYGKVYWEVDRQINTVGLNQVYEQIRKSL